METKKIVFLIIGAILVLVAILFYLFFGLVGLIGSIILLITLLFFALYSTTRDKTLAELEREKQCIENELKLANARLLQHKISEQAFRMFNEQKQKELLAIESQISAKKVEQKIDEFSKEKMPSLNPKRKHVAEQLLKEKSLVLKEMSAAKKKYLKRHLDDLTYKNITADQQKRLLEIELKLKALYNEEAQDIIKKTAKQLKAIEAKEWEQEKEVVATELYEQLKELSFSDNEQIKEKTQKELPYRHRRGQNVQG